MSRLFNERKFTFRLSLLTIVCSGLLFTQSPSYAQTPANPKQTTRQQVNARVMTQAESDLKDAAKRYNWKDHTIKMNVFIPNEVANYQRCSSPLGVSIPSGNRASFSRLRYDIHCNDTSSWTVSVTVKPDIYMPIVMSKNTVERGQKVAPSDIELKRHNISNARNGYIIDPDEVIGLAAKRRIRPLQVITPSLLDSPILVTRGQRVIMIAQQDGIEARTMGEAMKNGRKGDLIQVKNLSTKKTVSAVVDQPGVVRMSYALGH